MNLFRCIRFALVMIGASLLEASTFAAFPVLPADVGGALDFLAGASPADSGSRSTRYDTVEEVPLPVIAIQPNVNAGGSPDLILGANFTINVVTLLQNHSVSYQWYRNDIAIEGASSAWYGKSMAEFSDAGTYYVVASNIAGSVTSDSLVVTVNNPPSLGRPINLSLRGPAGTGRHTLIAGFVISGKTDKELLVRVAGPSLDQFGVNFIPDPSLSIYDNAGARQGYNDNWDPSLVQTFSHVGAFPWSEGSKDAACLVRLKPGSYTVQVGGGDDSGKEALVEVYDFIRDGSSSLINISARVDENEVPLILGTVTDSSARLLARNVGPGLEPFLSGFANDTMLSVFDATKAQVASNDNWEAGLEADATHVGAFALTPGSLDAAVEFTANGSVTIQAKANAPGIGLVEIYLVK